VTDPFIIREATAAHVADILNLEIQITGLSHIREREIVGAATSAHDCLVCTDGAERVIGYVVLTKRRSLGVTLFVSSGSPMIIDVSASRPHCWLAPLPDAQRRPCSPRRTNRMS